jgi:hypothetical protein
LPFIAYGVIYSRFLAIAGIGVLLLAMFGWAMEPSVADESDYDPVLPDDGGPGTALATTTTTGGAT